MKIETVPEQKTTIQVIERMVALLDALAKYPDPVSLKELSKVSGLHPSTAHRILKDLVTALSMDDRPAAEKVRDQAEVTHEEYLLGVMSGK